MKELLGKLNRLKARLKTKVGSFFPPEFLQSLKQATAQAICTDLAVTAGSLAFTTVLSLVPLLAVAFSVFQLIGGFEKTYDRVIPYLLETLSEGTGSVVAEKLYEFILAAHAKAVGWAGIGGLLITSLATYRTVASAFDKIWGGAKNHSLLHRIKRLGLLFSLGPLLLGASLAVTTAVAAQVRHVPFSGQFVAWLLSILLFILVYALVPVVRLPIRTIATGAILPATLLEAAKFGYAIYAKKMVSYSAFYGSFAAVPLFLLWIYIAWYITLLGAVWVNVLHLWNQKRGIK